VPLGAGRRARPGVAGNLQAVRPLSVGEFSHDVQLARGAVPRLSCRSEFLAIILFVTKRRRVQDLKRAYSKECCQTGTSVFRVAPVAFIKSIYVNLVTRTGNTCPYRPLPCHEAEFVQRGSVCRLQKANSASLELPLTSFSPVHYRLPSYYELGFVRRTGTHHSCVSFTL
jgi:hypothetical protein